MDHFYSPTMRSHITYILQWGCMRRSMHIVDTTSHYQYGNTYLFMVAPVDMTGIMLTIWVITVVLHGGTLGVALINLIWNGKKDKKKEIKRMIENTKFISTSYSSLLLFNYFPLFICNSLSFYSCLIHSSFFWFYSSVHSFVWSSESFLLTTFMRPSWIHAIELSITGLSRWNLLS